MNLNEIKQYILRQGSDCINTFGGDFRGGIYLQQNPDEISEILFFLLQQEKINSMLEVGSASGANAKVFCEILKINDLFIIDNNQHDRHVLRPENLKNIEFKEYIGDSQTKEAGDWLSKFNIKFDIIYIDADHSYNGVKKDVQNYLPFLSEDGFMIFHDSVCCEGVSRLISEIELFNLSEIFSSKHKLGITICSRKK
jgi:predicted O-methyltransferase YrrM